MRTFFTGTFSLLLCSFVAGCQHAPRSAAAARPRPAAYALAVTLRDGLHPSPSQWAAIQSTFARALAANGMVLVTEIGLADRILRIDFFPDPQDPENRGQAVIVGVRVNDQRGVLSPPSPLMASHSSFPYPFGWGGYSWGSLNPGFAYDAFYGYGNTYFDGYTYATPTLNPRRPKPSQGDCPPGLASDHRHPRRPEDPSPFRRPVPPADDPRPALLAAAEPTLQTATLRAYPTSDPRELVFADDVRRFALQRRQEDHASFRLENQPRSEDAAAGTSTQGSYARTDRPRTSTDRDWSRFQASAGDTRGNRPAEDHQRYRAEGSYRPSSGNSSTSSDSPRSASSSSSAAASSPSPANDSYTSSPPPSASPAVFSEGPSIPVGGSGPSAAPTTPNTEEK